MEINYLVATRNNPVALAGLLSSMLAVGYLRLNNLQEKDCLTIIDGSNDPVIADPHIARLLTRFKVVYVHTLKPNLCLQRLEGFRILARSDVTTCVIDDDHVLLKDPYEAFVVSKTNNHTVFGTAVDALNDKRYPDYEFAKTTPDVHSFYPTGLNWVYPFDIKHANAGFMVCSPKKAFSMLEDLLMTGATPNDQAVTDDCFARLMTDGKPLFHTHMCALHVGNKAGWWGTGHKQVAVDLLTKGHST